MSNKIENQCFKKLIKHLYDKHYLTESSSMSVTSSHWEKVGNNFVVYDQEKDEVNLGPGHGFGDFIPKDLTHSLKYLFPRFLLGFYLKKFVKNNFFLEQAKSIATKTNRHLSFDCCKQIVILERILSKSNQLFKGNNFTTNNIKNICIIGDGYGYMGSLIKKIDSEVKIVSVNLGKQLLYDLYFTHKVFCDTVSYNLVRSEHLNELHADFTFLEAENSSLLAEMKIDLFINIASMQEMNGQTIAEYFHYMRENKKYKDRVLFYSVNRLEKNLPGGEIVRAQEFPWGDSKTLLESIPEWYSCYPSNRPPDFDTIWCVNSVITVT